MNPPAPPASNGALPSWYGGIAMPSQQLQDLRAFKDRSRETHLFKLGLMISVFWTEPMRNVNGSTPSGSARSGTVTALGGGTTVYSNVRRFIVIDCRNLFCNCVPVTTYGERGCKKRGINVEDHAIVADARKRPQPLDGEPPLEKGPIYVDLFWEPDTLSPASRVNLGSIMTVHYNLDIRILGQVIPRSIPRLKQYLPDFRLLESEGHPEYQLPHYSHLHQVPSSLSPDVQLRHPHDKYIPDTPRSALVQGSYLPEQPRPAPYATMSYPSGPYASNHADDEERYYAGRVSQSSHGQY
ncbi:hypothetical protein VTN02DRAFT_1566 [Thermoascus thermophilus]